MGSHSGEATADPKAWRQTARSHQWPSLWPRQDAQVPLPVYILRNRKQSDPNTESRSKGQCWPPKKNLPRASLSLKCKLSCATQSCPLLIGAGRQASGWASETWLPPSITPVVFVPQARFLHKPGHRPTYPLTLHILPFSLPAPPPSCPLSCWLLESGNCSHDQPTWTLSLPLGQQKPSEPCHRLSRHQVSFREPGTVDPGTNQPLPPNPGLALCLGGKRG